MELSPAVYMVLCGLVRDGLEVESDATPILRKALGELSALAMQMPPELANDKMEALRRGGFAG